MNIPRALSRLWPHRYYAKVLAVVLCCSLAPMLALVSWMLWNSDADPRQVITGMLIGLVGVLLGTLLSLLLIYRLLAPLRRAAAALDAYRVDKQLPQLPENRRDEIGQLMRGINRCLRGIDAGRVELERHALEDPLTGAMNRRGCEQALAHSVTESQQQDAQFVLFVVDLDNLKPINDEYGHSAGDQALIALVDSAHACCLGADDWIGRWGGDEFLLGMHDELLCAQDRIRAWLKALASPAAGNLPVFVSAGCANYQPGQDALQLYRQADAAMYQAKFSGGRTLVCGATMMVAGESPVNVPSAA